MRLALVLAGLPVVLVASAFSAACSGSPVLPPSPSDEDSGASSELDAGIDGSAPPIPSERDLPCDLDALLIERCHECHGSPGEGLPRLVTYEDLVSPLASRPEERVIDAALQRVSADRGRMPPVPLPRLPRSEIEILSDWIDAGTPRGSCRAEDAESDASTDAGE